MDQLSLLKLLSDSTKKLSSLHEELGHAPDRLEDAIASLHKVLHAAVEGQLDKVQKEVDDARREISEGQIRIEELKIALGERVEPAADKDMSAAPASSSRVASHSSSRKASASSNTTEQHSEPLLPRVQSTNAEANRLQTLYNSRKSQADKLTSQLDSFRPILGDFVPEIKTENTEQGQQIIPSHHLVQLSATIDKCGHELTHRSEQLQELLLDILGLWSELCLAPEHSQDSEAFDSLILRHLDLKPLFEHVGDDEHGKPVYDFQGNFQGLGAAAAAASEDDDGASQQQSTPTRHTRSSGNHTTLRSERSADTHFPPHILIPSPQNISRAEAKQSWLRDEKQRREDRIQTLYDELLELWMKFGVTTEEMDDFVMNNSGSTLAVVESYEAELSKMQELKKTHMVYFISQVRETMDSLWTQLRTSAEEKEVTFPEYFFPLDGEAEASEMDALLAKHEAFIAQLEGEIETKLPILKIVTRYFDVLEEEKQLEESAKDSTRLMRGVRGDPGRLLREEKMRKKVKIQKPKLEAELLKAIPAWEADHNRGFTVDGERYYEKILALAEASAPKKRTRTVSTASQAPPPVTQTPLQHSSTHTNRMGVTPMRGGAGGVGASASGVKRAKLASSTAATPATTGQLRAKVAAQPASSNRQASTSKIPMPASPTRTAAANGAENPFRKATSAASTRPPVSSSSQHATRPPVSSSRHATATQERIKRVSTEGYQATHVFRPRPSTTTTTLPRNMSGTSIASDATTLHYAGIASQPAYLNAIPTNASRRIGPHIRRGPSLSLEGALASLGARTASIRQVTHTHTHNDDDDDDVEDVPTGSGGSGGNWARLDEEDEEGEETRRAQLDEMEVF